MIIFVSLLHLTLANQEKLHLQEITDIGLTHFLNVFLDEEMIWKKGVNLLTQVLCIMSDYIVHKFFHRGGKRVVKTMHLYTYSQYSRISCVLLWPRLQTSSFVYIWGCSQVSSSHWILSMQYWHKIAPWASHFSRTQWLVHMEICGCPRVTSNFSTEYLMWLGNFLAGL